MLTTVQDLGRFGWAHFGISASGAADPLALRAGNLLVGNAENAAALEMTLIGGAFEFERTAVIALTGSDFGAGLPLWEAVEVKAGTVVRCGATKSGARSYLCVRGGIAATRVMGSASVHVMTGVGGRALRAGDVLPIGESAVRRPRGPARDVPDYVRDGHLRITPAAQADWYQSRDREGASSHQSRDREGAPSKQSRDREGASSHQNRDREGADWWHNIYRVSEESNRMGIRLLGPAIPSPAGHMLTEGVPLGAIQVPPDGQPIILFVEHQTTGGYPKPGNVISADFCKLGQLRPRDEVRFEMMTIDEALGELQEQEKWLWRLGS